MLITAQPTIPPKAMEESVCSPEQPYPDIIGLVSPGFVKASIFVGFMYCVYLWDQSIAKTKKDRIGPLHRFVNWAVASGEEHDVYYAGIEEVRQRNKDHMNLGQRPKYRVSYPEYVPSTRTVNNGLQGCEFGESIWIDGKGSGCEDGTCIR